MKPPNHVIHLHESRTKSAFCLGHTARTASTVSYRKRARFCREPPYLVKGIEQRSRDESHRWLNI